MNEQAGQWMNEQKGKCRLLWVAEHWAEALCQFLCLHICLSGYEVNFLKEFDLRFCLAVF